MSDMNKVGDNMTDVEENTVPEQPVQETQEAPAAEQSVPTEQESESVQESAEESGEDQETEAAAEAEEPALEQEPEAEEAEKPAEETENAEKPETEGKDAPAQQMETAEEDGEPAEKAEEPGETAENGSEQAEEKKPEEENTREEEPDDEFKPALFEFPKVVTEADIKEEKRVKAIRIACVAAFVLLAVISIVVHFVTKSGNGQIFPVYISEMLASNSSYPNEDGRCSDFIELHNGASYPVDLSGFQLGDISGSGRYVFPEGTTIAPGEYYVVYCDTEVKDNPAYASFGISRVGGETFYLVGTNSAILDEVETIASDMDQSMIRGANENWTLSNVPTPGKANDATGSSGSDVYNAGISPVRINEVSTANAGYAAEYGISCDWVELYNTASQQVDISGYVLTDNAGNNKFVFPEGTIMAPGEYKVVNCMVGVDYPDIAPFSLSRYGGESVILKNSDGMIAALVNTVEMDARQSLAMGDGMWFISEEPSPGYENTAAGHRAFLRDLGAEPGTIVISEVASDTIALLPDSYSDFPDWVELYNAGDRSVDLAGWFLSDDENNPQKWVFPSAVLDAGERMVVFCSGRDTVGENGDIHASFSLSSHGETLTLCSYVGSVVDTVTFGEAETNVSFVFENGEVSTSMYPTPGYANDMESYEKMCSTMKPLGALAIWELMTSNDWYLPQELGNCYDWVTLKNVSNSEINLADYSITDELDPNGAYKLPDKKLQPGGTITIILSGNEKLSNGNYYHAGFSLDAKKEQLFVYDNEGRFSDFVYIYDIPYRKSYGRLDGQGGFFYMTPTPNGENGSGMRTVSSEPTSAAYAPGVYSSDTGFVVPLEGEGTIFYTTDGSEPNAQSLRYEGPITVNSTQVIRAVSVEEGKMRSDIYTATFVVGDHHDLPVVSLVTDPSYLWGPGGVYKNGDMSVKERKFLSNVSYSGEDGVFSMDCEMNLHGATTVLAFNKKSFSVHFEENLDGRLNYDVFEDGEVTNFSSLIIRTSHEDSFSTQMHDYMMGMLASEVSDTLISQKGKYVALYLNGQYWGLYALREQHSEEHYASYMNVPADTVTIIRYPIYGANGLQTVYGMAEDGVLSVPENFEYAKSVIDMSSIIDWMIMEAYVCNVDINGNMRYYYSTVDGLWRCGLVDVDLGICGGMLGFEEVAECFSHGPLVSGLMKNAEFRDMLIARFRELITGPMSDENMLARIQDISDHIRSETVYEEARWDTPVTAWEKFVNIMVNYCDGRAEEMAYSLCYALGLPYNQWDMVLDGIVTK